MASKVKINRKIKPLVAELQDGDEAAREQAIARVRELGPDAKQAVLAVIACLADEEDSLRYQAFHCLCELYPALEKRQDLASSFQNPDLQVRLAGIRELVRILPEVQKLLAARQPGWRSLERLVQQTDPERRAKRLPPRDVPPADREQPESATEGPMEQQTEKPAVKPVAGANREDQANGPAVTSIHLIRIPDRAQRERAFQALLGTGEGWVSAPGSVMGLSSGQIKALQAAGVAFEWVSKAAPHG